MTERDELEDYVAEAMADPEFARLYAEAGRRSARRGRWTFWWRPWMSRHWWAERKYRAATGGVMGADD